MESIIAWGFGGLLTGLREGVEAALIVGIIASSLVKIGRADRLASVWLGVFTAIVAAAAIGVVHSLLSGVSRALPSRSSPVLPRFSPW